MPSELQRVAEQLLATLDEIPRVVAYLHDRASKYRESAGWVGNLSNNPSARMAAVQLEEAARRCEEAAHLLSMAPPRARSWVEQMVSGVRTAEPAGGSTAPGADSRGGIPPLADHRRDDDRAEPKAGASDRRNLQLDFTDLSQRQRPVADETRTKPADPSRTPPPGRSSSCRRPTRTTRSL